MNFNFGEVLSRAWQIIWKHRVLWIFGILASCSQGRSGYNSGNSGRTSGGGTGNLPPEVQTFLQNFLQHATTYIAIFIAVICIFWIIAIFLGTIGKIGLIRGTWQAESGTEHLIFGQLFSESTPYFWRIFGLSLILALPVFVVAFITAILVVLGVLTSRGDTPSLSLIGSVPLIIGCFCLLIPVMIVLGLVWHQAERAIVLDDMPVLPAISRGWDIFRNNLGPIVVMAILLFVITLVAGLIIAIPIFLVVFPSMIAFFVGNQQNWTPLVFMGLCLCLYIPISLLLNGIVISYVEAVWTLTYMRLTGKPKAGEVLPPDSGTPPPPPPADDTDRTIISSSHA